MIKSGSDSNSPETPEIRSKASSGGGGGGGGEGFTPLYKPYRYVPPQKVGFLRHFGLKTGIDFAHFDLEFGIVYVRTTIVYQCVRRFNS